MMETGLSAAETAMAVLTVMERANAVAEDTGLSLAEVLARSVLVYAAERDAWQAAYEEAVSPGYVRAKPRKPMPPTPAPAAILTEKGA